MRCVALLSLLAVAAFADDSELVQASKRARSAKGKPHTTITNKDLKKTGGHITTTKKKPKALAVETRVPKPAPPVTPPAPPAAAPAPEFGPFADSEGYGPEDREALEEANTEIIANIPASMAAKPQFTKPKVAPPTTPPYTKPVAPTTSPTVTPQYTPPSPPPATH